ncbi:MAG TPA: tetratricopeptide repeat protein [Bryobacteraceae bacterium]|nr:tetratricopeptide repeat protein [Bryobacteraceae bacterium]
MERRYRRKSRERNPPSLLRIPPETSCHRFRSAPLRVAARSRQFRPNLLHRQPDSMDARRGLAAIALDAGDLNEALEHHLKLLEMGEKTPDVFYNTGLLSQKLGKTEEAATHYRSALNERPEFPEALLNLGHVLKSLGREDQAKTYWALAIEAKPDLAAGYFRQ